MIPPKKQQMNPQAAMSFKQPVRGDKRVKPQAKSPIKRPPGRPSPKLFQAPIPGQSLTAEPKNRPYETPPEIADPEEALRMHLTRLNDVEKLDTAMTLLQRGVDVRTLTEGVLRSAVSEGIHSIDVSLIIAPTIHDFITDVADEVGIDYKTGFEPDEQEEDKQELSLVRSMLRKSEGDSPRPRMEEEPMEEPEQETELDLGEPKEAPKGLMARM